MSYTYEIFSWDPVNVSDNVLAMIYIKPDLKLLDLFNISPLHNILLTINNTGSDLYDGRVIFGKIDKSSDVPDCRQNIFNCTGLYVVTLDSKWYGYPPDNGTVTFESGTVDKLIDKLIKPSAVVTSEPHAAKDVPPPSSPKSNGFDSTFLTVCGTILLVLLIGSMAVIN